MTNAYGILREVKWHIARYHEIKKAVAEARLERKRRNGTAGRRSVGYVSDPTATEAINNLTAIKRVTLPDGGVVKAPEAWIGIIDSVMDQLDSQDRRLISAAFWERRAWHETIDSLHLNKMTYYRRRDQLLAIFAVAAATKGLISL